MKEKLIYGQCNSPIAQLCYGRTRQTVAKTGCGAVAVYNALVLSGKNAVFEDVLREMERLRMPWMFGLFGTKPFALRRYFRKNNIPYKNYLSSKSFKNALHDGKIGIVCAWNRGFKGLHFYCLYRENDNLLSLNFISSNKAQSFELSEITPLRFVTGYIL